METIRWQQGHGEMIRSQMQRLAYKDGLKTLNWLSLLNRVAAHGAPGYRPPAPDYIRVVDIAFSYDRRSVTARVLVWDEDDQPVEGAAISGFWVYPVNRNNNTILFFGGTTASDGYATFNLASSRPGDYRLNIEQLSKDGFEPDYDGSTLVGRFTRPKK